MAAPLFGRDLGTRGAIKRAKLCIHYNGLLGLFLSSQGPIDYLSNDSRGCTVDVWRSSDLRELISWSTDLSWKPRAQPSDYSDLFFFKWHQSKHLTVIRPRSCLDKLGRCSKNQTRTTERDSKTTPTNDRAKGCQKFQIQSRFTEVKSMLWSFQSQQT